MPDPNTKNVTSLGLGKKMDHQEPISYLIGSLDNYNDMI